MELDELKQAWQTLGRQLERHDAIQLELLRDRKLDAARRTLRPLYWGQAMQVLLGIGLVLLGIGCWSRAPGATLFATGITVHAFGVVNIILAGITMGLLASIDYSAPVLAIQKQNARLLRAYLFNSTVCGMGWWLMWLPVTMAFAGLGRIDLARQAPMFLWSGLAISVAGLAVTAWWMRRARRRAEAADASRGSERCSLGDGADGIRRSLRQLDEIARFERD